MGMWSGYAAPHSHFRLLFDFPGILTPCVSTVPPAHPAQFAGQVAGVVIY